MLTFGLRLPTDRLSPYEEFCSQDALLETAAVAERAGFDFVYVTDHPFPDYRLAAGYHALDPFVALSVAAAATRTLRLATVLLVLPYRNPFISAKAVASLDHISNGRVILGVGAGYVPGEFAALGADFNLRNQLTDETIDAMRQAWSQESVELTGTGFTAAGNSMLPRPRQLRGPPIWVGGNSKIAIRRAVARGDGWLPMHNPGRVAARRRTAALSSPGDLVRSLAYAKAYSRQVDKAVFRDVIFGPPGISRFGAAGWTADRVADEVGIWQEAGVTSVLINIQGNDSREFLGLVRRFGAEVIPRFSE
jgi:probable F420-dependent oxidoreductase